MNLNKLIDAINEMSHEKEMNREQIISILESTIKEATERKFPQYETMEAVYNKENHIIELFYYKTIVDSVYDENNEISLEEAHEIDPEAEPGDELQYEIEAGDYMSLIGQSTRQILFQKIRDIEQEKILEKYRDQVFEIVHGTVGRVDRAEVSVALTNKAEGILDRYETIPMEKHEPGDHIRVLLLKIIESGRIPKLILSRTHPMFLRKLMEIEIPEIYDKSVEIVDLVREPGRRAKVSVRSNDTEIDPVGSCIGQGGNRIHPVSAELHDERIDIIEYSDDITVYIGRALAPAVLTSITVNTEEKTAEVEVESEYLSKAIGRQGQNVRLASKLTCYKINVFSAASQIEDNVDFDLDEALKQTIDLLPERTNNQETEEKPVNDASDAEKPVENPEGNAASATDGKEPVANPEDNATPATDGKEPVANPEGNAASATDGKEPVANPEDNATPATDGKEPVANPENNATPATGDGKEVEVNPKDNNTPKTPIRDANTNLDSQKTRETSLNVPDDEKNTDVSGMP